MAKAGFWLRGARGKLAGASLQKGENGTIMREIVTPTNPKTLGQAIQRLAFSTAVRTAKALEMIIDHSFEGIKYGAASVRHFTKLAVPVFKAAIMNAQSYNGVKLVPALPMGNLITSGNPMQVCGFPVSVGSLDAPSCNLIELHEGDPFNFAETALNIEDFPAPSATATLENLLANGWDITKQLTLICIGTPVSVENAGGTQFYGSGVALIARVNFKAGVDISTPLYTAQDSNFILNTAVLDLERCTNVSKLVFVQGKGVTFDEGGGVAWAAILSKYVDGEWRRSTSYLLSKIDFSLEEGNKPVHIAQSRSGYNNFDELIAAYDSAGSANSDRYLNREVNSDMQYNPAEEEEEEEPEP